MSNKKKPEEKVRQTIIKKLEKIGWKKEQMRWKPEWAIPDTPHDLTKRERGQKYKICGYADLVLFEGDTQEWQTIQVIFEFKSPNITEGKSQLIRYLSNEPLAKMGYWTNGNESIAIYKTHDNDWKEIKNAPLPQPGDNFSIVPKKALTWEDLKIPTETELSGALKRIVVATVINDTISTRREDQLKELIHILLVKLESDAYASKSKNRKKPVKFRIYGNDENKISATASAIREQFNEYFSKQQKRIFNPEDTSKILLNDETIFSVVNELATYRVFGDNIDILAKAFQVFRTSALKSKEGQYLTPLRIVRPAVMALEITSEDKVIDPACGAGSFLTEALRQVQKNEFPDEDEQWEIVKWANDNLYGIDKDSLGIKLTRAMMVAMKDGSTHTLLGDAVRVDQWVKKYPKLLEELGKEESPYVLEQFTVVVTNPPFGTDLKVSISDCNRAGYTIHKHASKQQKTISGLEIGLVYLELSHRLLLLGGRLGIILPETYFFSPSYRWLPDWLDGRFALRGMLNIPMEAFEEFCRAKTNFYIFEKIGYGMEEEENGNK